MRKLQRDSDDVINIHQFLLEWQLLFLASLSLQLLPTPHGGEGEGHPARVLAAKKGGSPSVHGLFKEPTRSPLKGMQGTQLSYWLSEKRVRIFCGFLFTQRKDVGIYIRANLTRHIWESLQRNRAF